MDVSIASGCHDTRADTPHNIVMSGPVSASFSHMYHFLRSEGYAVGWAAPQAAFEQVRWERPALVIVNAETDPTGTDALVARLARDPRTRRITILSWYGARQTEATTAVGRQKIVALHAPFDPHTILHHVRELTAAPHTDQINPAVRAFVDCAIPDWPTFRIAAYLGQAADPYTLVNIRLLCHALDMPPDVVGQALVALENAGYIEPVEVAADPLFAPVADAARLAVLRDFGRAVAAPAIRLTLATLILARERHAA